MTITRTQMLDAEVRRLRRLQACERIAWAVLVAALILARGLPC